MEAKKVNLLAVAIFAVFTGLLFWKLDGELRSTTAELDRVRAELRRVETAEKSCDDEINSALDDALCAWDDMDEAYDELLRCEEGLPTGLTDCTECWDIYSWSEAYEEEPPC
jgi:hypothetical protein